MWLFTRHGFYSAVSAIKDGKADPSRVVVRARLRKHLEALCESFAVLPPAGKIGSSGKTDYRYRIIVDSQVWAAVVHTLSLEIDYTNFKSACPDPEYHDWLMSVWSAGWKAQEKEQLDEHYENLEGSSERPAGTPRRDKGPRRVRNREVGP